MSNTPVTVAIALVMVLATPAASFARGGGSAPTAQMRARGAAVGAAMSALPNPSGLNLGFSLEQLVDAYSELHQALSVSELEDPKK